MVRQSWPFFQNDFAGRIANRVMQTAQRAARERDVEHPRGLVHRASTASRALVLMALADWRLGAADARCGSPATSSSCATSCRACATSRRASSEARSHVMGRVVDSYTNILTVKLFARARRRGRLRARVDRRAPGGDAAPHARSSRTSCSALAAMNAALLVGTAAIGIWLWAHGTLERRRRRDRAAARVADRQRRGLGELGGDRHLREHRRGAGRHADDRRAAHRRRPPGRARARGVARRDPLRERDLQLRPQRRAPVLDDLDLDDPARRARRPGRPLGRGQVDARQPAAALLRARGGPHPDRRPGHRAT